MITFFITSSALILIIALARLLLRKRVSQRLTYSLWLLVVLRLLIPFEFGQWNYSLATVAQPAVQQVQQAAARPISGPDREVLYQELLQEYMAALPQPEVAKPVAPEVQTQLWQEALEKEAPSHGQVLLAVWLAGAVGMALWFVTANLIFFRKARKNSVLWGKENGVPIRICPHIPSPCLVGLLRPVIYLTPDNVQDETTLAHILAHEKTHLRHWDPLWSLVRCLCLCIYWFNPLVWMAALLSKRDCELACDEAALTILGDDSRISYGKTLMQVVTRSRSPAHIMDMATSMSESKNQLKERMRLIVKKPKTMMTAAAALILIALLVTGCAFLGGKPDDTSGNKSTAPNSSNSTPSTSGTNPSAPADPIAQLTGALQGYWVNLRTVSPIEDNPMRYCYEYMWLNGTELSFGLTYSDGIGRGTVTEVKQLSTSAFEVTSYTPESGMDTEYPVREHTVVYTFTVLENAVIVKEGNHADVYAYMCQFQGSNDATRTHIESLLSQRPAADFIAAFTGYMQGYWIDMSTVTALPDQSGQYTYQYMYFSGNTLGFGQTYCDGIEEIGIVTEVQNHPECRHTVTCNTPDGTRVYAFDAYGSSCTVSFTADGQTVHTDYRYICPDQGSAADTHAYIEKLLQAQEN